MKKINNKHISYLYLFSAICLVISAVINIIYDGNFYITILDLILPILLMLLFFYYLKKYKKENE